MNFINYLLGEPQVIEKEKKVIEFVPENRYSSYISIDKPIYKLEDNIFIKIVVLHSNLLTPYSECKTPTCSLKFYGPKNDELQDITLDSFVLSTFSYCFQIPDTFCGGKYKIKATFSGQIISSEREFEIREFQNPRLNSQIEFIRKGYGAGDKVVASLDSKRVEGGFPEKATVDASATIDGVVVWKEKYTLNEKGNCLLQFTLPTKIKTGEGNVTCIIQDGGVLETATKTIPIFLKSMKVVVFPEGGDFVENLESRFYVEAATSYGDPADIHAEIITKNGEVVGTITTKHEGRGKASFTPKPKEEYSLRVVKPSGVTDLIKMPSALPSGIVLTASDEAYESDGLIGLSIQASKPGFYYASIFKREIELSRVKIKIEKELEKKDFFFSTPSNQSGSGVLRVLITDGGAPLAERLIFRKPSNSIHTTISPDLHHYSPGGKVKVDIQTRDSDGKSVNAIVGIVVTDLSVIETLEKRKRPPTLPTMIYLESDVEHLEDAEIYLSNDQKSEMCIDLLLGTQGWRRFCFNNAKQFLADKKEKAERVLGLKDQDDIKIIETSTSDSNSKPYYLGLYDKTGKRIDEYQLDNQRDISKYRTICKKVIDKNPISSTSVVKKSYSFEDRQIHFISNANNYFIIITPEDKSKKMVYFFLEQIINQKNLKDVNLYYYQNEYQFNNYGYDSDYRLYDQSTNILSNDLLSSRIEKLIDRSETLDSLQRQTESLSFGAVEFKSKAQSYKQPNLFSGITSMFNQPPSNPSVKIETQKQSIPVVKEKSIKTPEKGQEETKYISIKNYSPKVIENSGYIREYAHKVRSNKKLGERIDFTETLYYSAAIQTQNGKYSFTFDLSDSITSFSILTESFSNSGNIGANSVVIQSSEPFYIEPKLPIEVTVGDQFKVPLSFVNNSQENQDIQFSTEILSHFLTVEKNSKGKTSVKPNERKREIIDFEAKQIGDIPITFHAKSDSCQDKVSRNVKIVSNGFPVSQSSSGFLSQETNKMIIPISKLLKGTLKGSFTVYTSVEHNIFSAVGSLVQEPYGCFEQTSSTSFPLTMAYHVLAKQNPLNTNLISSAMNILERSYKKLIGYECRSGGFEWFGNGDGVETLTAYGILQFNEMSKIIDVDQNMLNRNLKWLLDRRDGKGGFKINEGKSYQLSHGKIPQIVSDSYILWALTESKVTGLEKEISSVSSRAKDSSDSYALALASIALSNSGKAKEAEDLAQILSERQDKNGFIKGGVDTITKSSGLYLQLEVTALAVIAFTKLNKFAEHKLKAIEFLYQSCEQGRFGGTQSTVLSLKAIIDNYVEAKDINLSLTINQKELKFDIPPKAQFSVSIVDYLKEGDNVVELTSSGSLPFSIDVNYHSTLPKTIKDCRLGLETFLSKDVFSEGETGQLSFNLTNLSDENHGMCVTVLSLPGGIEPDHERLKEMVKEEKFAFYEIFGRSIVLYFNHLEAKAKLSLNLNVIARIPGKFEGQANRAYIYYSNQDTVYVPGLKCSIDPK